MPNEVRAARTRHNTIAFWLSDEEKEIVEARITVSGMQKGEYYRAAVLGYEAKIGIGRYKSDRLSKTLDALMEKTEGREEEDYREIWMILKELKELMKR